MTPDTWVRMTTAAGTLSAGLLLASLFVAGSGSLDPSSDPSAIAASLAEDRSGMQWAAMMQTLSVVLLLVFMGAVRARLGNDWTSAIVIAAGATLSAVVLAHAGLLYAAASADWTGQPEVATVMAALSWNAMAIFGAPVAALVAGSTAAVWRSRATSAWYARGTLYAGGALTIATLAMPWMAVFFFAAWMLWLPLGLLGAPAAGTGKAAGAAA